MTHPIDVVVFDLGNVLIEWDRERLYRQVIPDDERRSHFFAEVATMEWNLDLDRGVPFDDGVRELSARHPEWTFEIEAYRDRWTEMLGPADDAAVALLRELNERGVGTYGLTNWSAETFPRALERFDFLAELDGLVVSGQEGLVKPEAAIFDLCCARFDLDPARLLFTDDSPGNVEGAIAAGWSAVVWTGAAPFRAELELRGVL